MNEIQRIERLISGSGTWMINERDDAPIPWDAGAPELQTALDIIFGADNTLGVQPPFTAYYIIEFLSPANTPVALVTAEGIEDPGAFPVVELARGGSGPLVTLSVDTATIAENGGTATITATLAITTSDTVIVDLVFSGSASYASDYAASTTSIVIASGDLTGTSIITGADDVENDDDETIVVDIDSITAGYEDGAQQVTITITDDDEGSGALWIATGALTCGGTILSGSATVTQNLATATLTCGAPVIAGQVVVTQNIAAGALACGATVIAGQAIVTQNLASGALTCGGAILSASATVTHYIATGALTTGPAAIAGSANVTQNVATAALICGALAITGQVVVTQNIATAALTSGPTVIAGQAVIVQNFASGALTCGPLLCSGSATVTQNLATGALTTGPAAIAGSAVVTQNIATATLTCGATLIAGQAVVTQNIATAALTCGATLIAGQAIVTQNIAQAALQLLPAIIVGMCRASLEPTSIVCAAADVGHPNAAAAESTVS